jgi:hypothetical protein
VEGEVQEFEYESTNPFGGEPFPIISKAYFHELNNSVAIIRSEEFLIPEDLKRVLISTFKKITEAGGRPFNESELPEFNIETKGEIRYDIQAQKLLLVCAHRKIKASGIEQNQITEIRLLD